MIMWFKRKLRDWVDDAYDYDGTDSLNIPIKDQDMSYLDQTTLPDDYVDNYNLRIWKAVGGRCIQYRQYKSNGHTASELYVISDNEDLGESIKNIVIQEKLKGN